MSADVAAPLIDERGAARVLRAPESLRSFNAIGVLAGADVHVALALTELAGEADPSVQLATALAVRAPRLGHVFVDLATVIDTVAVESEEIVDLSALAWPEAADWIAAVGRNAALVAVGSEEVQSPRPLRLIGTRLYLDRYWREERLLAADLVGGRDPDVDAAVLGAGVNRLFAGAGDHLQRCAAACAVLRRLSVIGGGPGTGKTTTVARIAALLYEQAAAGGGREPLIALAAPTGKAAARLQEAVHEEAARLPIGDSVRGTLLELRATTIHRLLGSQPGSHSHFRHNRSNSLPHDVVIVDETSMVSLSLMARLLEAIRADARIVLVGDPGQLTAIEAGAVLRDIVGPAADGPRMSRAMRETLSAILGAPVAASEPPAGVTIADGIVVLERVHRFGAGIAAIADAIRRGDGDRAVAALRAAPGSEVQWIEVDAGVDEGGPRNMLAPVRDGALAAGRAMISAARSGDGLAALEALSGFRVLCAHRRGPHGVATWTGQIEQWLADEIDGFEAGERDYVGRPLLVTQNDYELRLYNGDTGVIVRSAPDRVGAVFERGGGLVSFTPARLGPVETVHAMTIHKSQGSQFTTAVVLLPDPGSRILTRELVYTAVTRARERLIVVATEEIVRAAVARPVARASGLRERLWGG